MGEWANGRIRSFGYLIDEGAQSGRKIPGQRFDGLPTMQVAAVAPFHFQLTVYYSPADVQQMTALGRWVTNWPRRFIGQAEKSVR